MGALPWDGFVPLEDQQACARAYRARPDAGELSPALLVVDMTNQFVDPAYPLGCTSGPAVCDATAALLAVARRAGVPVFFTKGYPTGHVPSPVERGRWTSTPVRDPLADEIATAVAPESGETVLYKGSAPSAFFGTPLSSQLRQLAVDTIVAVGMTTSGCVRATAVDAFQHGFHVVVPQEAVGDRSRTSHTVSLFDIHVKYGWVVDLDDAGNVLRQGRDSRSRAAALA